MSLSRRRSVRFTVTAVLASCAVYATGSIPAHAYTRTAPVSLVTVACNGNVLSWSWDLDGGKPVSGYIWKKSPYWTAVQTFKVNRAEVVAGSKQVGGWNCDEANGTVWGIVLSNRGSYDSLDEEGNSFV